MERDLYAPGTPSWVDLESPDTDASAAFYGGLSGWACSEPADYRMFTLRGRNVAGLGPQLNPGPPHWTTYENVASCDDAAERVRSLGGAPFSDPMDIADVGRLCVVADPPGRRAGAVGARLAPRRWTGHEPGAWCRSVLSTRDGEAAARFYGELFGWDARAPGVERAGHPRPSRRDVRRRQSRLTGRAASITGQARTTRPTASTT